MPVGELLATAACRELPLKRKHVFFRGQHNPLHPPYPRLQYRKPIFTLFRRRPMQRLDFKTAARHIKAVDAGLEALLRAIWRHAPRDRREELCFVIARYPFGNFVMKNGRALDPTGKTLPENLLIAGGLPCGVVLDNRLEVIDEVIRSEEIVEMPQSLLLRRELIGVFEVIDQHLEVEGRPVPDWTISSGSRSIKFLDFPTQKVQWDRLRARYKRLSTYDKATVRKLKEMDLIDMIGEVDAQCKKWVTEVLYFAPAWFDEAEQQLYEPETTGQAVKLFSYFQNSGWASLARVRDRANKLEDAINEWGGDTNAARCKAAYLLLRYSMDIVTQRRPCFVPLTGRMDVGPLDVIREKLLRVAKLNNNILGPVYLQPGDVGFLSLSQLAPSAFAKNPLDNLEDILRILSRAYAAANARQVKVPGLTNLSDLLSKMAFRVKSGRERGEGQHGSVTTFKVRFLQNNHMRMERDPISICEFYSPHFSENSFPPSDSRFFRVSLKLDLRDA